MTFAVPLFLLAALAAGIPVVLHLISRQRAKELPFSTLRFLRISVEKTRRRRRIHDLLLMLLRVAVLLLIALGLARPTITNLHSLLGGGAQSAVAILFDNSASMGAIDQGKTRFDTALGAARQILREVRPGDEIALWLTCGREFPAQGQFDVEHDKVQQMLDQCAVSYERTDLSVGVEQARKLLATSKSTNKQIYVLTDMQELSWEGLKKESEPSDAKGDESRSEEDRKAREIPLVIVDCNRAPAPNMAVQGVNIEATVPVAGLPIKAAVEVLNASSVASQRVVELYIDNAKEASSPALNVAPGERARHEFLFRFGAGGAHRGEVRLSGEDGNKLDDRRYFTMEVDQGIPVAICVGQRHEIPYLDDAFYLEKALSPASTGGAAIRPQVLTPGDLLSEPLSTFTAVYCVNVPALDADAAERLRTYVEQGGNLVWICGENVDPAAYNRMNELARKELLPAPLVEAREVDQQQLDPAAAADKILIAAWDAPPAGTRVLWDSAAGPLALQRPYGMGAITALGIDPTMVSSTPLRQAVASFDESLVLAPAIEDVRARHYWETSNVTPFSDTLTLPNRMIVILIIAAFVTIVGPMNFSFLRRRRRLELAWVTIPALSILFFSAIYTYGVISKGGHQQFGTVGIVHMSAGQPDSLMLWNAMQFSPRRDMYLLSAGPKSSMIPLLNCYGNPSADLNYNMGQRFINLTGLDRGSGSGQGSDAVASIDGGYDLAQRAAQWEAIYYVGEKPFKAKGGIDGEVTLLSDGSFRVRIENGSEAVLQDAVVRVGPQSVALGRIDPGQKITRNMQPTLVAVQEQRSDESENIQYRSGYRRPGRLPQARKSNEGPSSLPGWADNIANKQENVYPNLELVHPQRRCRLIARQDVWPSDVKVTPEPDMRTGLSLVEVDLPLRIEGLVRVASRDVLRREVYNCEVKSNSGGSYSFGDKGNFCELESAWADVLFATPRLAGPTRVAGGTIDIDYETPGQSAGIQIYNYQLNRWEAMLTGANAGQGRHQHQVPLKTAWVNPWTPLVRVRLEGIERRSGQQGGVVFHSLSMQMDLEPAK